ncbi:MAG: HypC/HybG/HupF family hydrogenase formation chaperone [Bacteriovoracaceae bacterium]
MCLAVPAKVISIENGYGIVEMQGLRKNINFELVPDVQVGNYVIIHVGMALSILNTEEADLILENYRELSQ